MCSLIILGRKKMDIKTYRWMQIIMLNAFCKGQINLLPTIIPWESEQWTLECSLNSIAYTVSITNPSNSIVGFCEPTDAFPASCTPNTGYTFSINETANTVSMTRTIENSETGVWTCQHSTDSATYTLSSPLPSRNFPDASTSYVMHSMTAPAGSELTTETIHSFTFHYGCVSSNVKFVWATRPESHFEDTSNTNSINFTCTTNSAYMSTLDTTASILQTVTSKGSKLKVSVYVDGYDSLTAAEYTYDVTFSPSPSTQTSTVFPMERMVTTTNYITDNSNIITQFSREIVAATDGVSEIIAPSSFVLESLTSNSLVKITTKLSDVEIRNTTVISTNTEISLNHTDSIDIFTTNMPQIKNIIITSTKLQTETPLSSSYNNANFLMSNLLISSFVSLSYLDLFSSQFQVKTNSDLPQTISSETLFVESGDMKGDTLSTIHYFLSKTSSTIAKPSAVSLTSISTSSVSFDPISSSTIVVNKSTDELIGSTFEITDLKVVSTVLKPFTRTTHLFISETSTYLSIISLSDMTINTSFFESSIYRAGIEDDIITTKNPNAGFFSNNSMHPGQSIGTYIRMNTSNSLMPTSMYASTTRTTETQMLMSGYLQSSFYPTEQDFSSNTTEYIVTSTRTTNLLLITSTENNPSTVNSNIRTTDIMASETQSSVYTVQNTEIYKTRNASLIQTMFELSDIGTTEILSKSEWDSSTSDHSFSRTISVNPLITTQYTLQKSLKSLLYSSDSSKILVSASAPFSTDISSTVFISTTIRSTSTSKARISETSKNVIFITIVSVVVVIVSVWSIILLTRIVLKKRNTTLQRKTDNASFSNDSQSVRRVFPEFPYTESSIYPRFSNSLSSYMTSPYEQNWNKV